MSHAWSRVAGSGFLFVAASMVACGSSLGESSTMAPCCREGCSETPTEEARGDAAPSAAAITPAAAAASSCPPGMQSIPAGTFLMGSAVGIGTADEQPAHHVTLPAFCLDRTEVTVAAYTECVRSGRCTAAFPTRENAWCNGERSDRQDHPINCVLWTQADAYCRAIGGRLPTEQEWEYAARGTDGRTYPWGNEPPDHTRLNAFGQEMQSVYLDLAPMYVGDDRSIGTAPVGSYPAGASPFGVMDLAGNVAELVEDHWGPYPSGQTTPTDERVCRGSGWEDLDPATVRAAYRSRVDSTAGHHVLGFRCARGV